MSRYQSGGADPGHLRSGVAGLRVTALAVIILLLIEYGLGMWVNLEDSVPNADHGTGFWGALSLHALLGTLLIATAIAVMVRAARTRRRLPSALAGIGLLAVLVAWLAGVHFVTAGDSGTSFLMALLTAVGLFCYVLIVFSLTPGEARTAASHRSGAGA